MCPFYLLVMGPEALMRERNPVSLTVTWLSLRRQNRKKEKGVRCVGPFWSYIGKYCIFISPCSCFCLMYQCLGSFQSDLVWIIFILLSAGKLSHVEKAPCLKDNNTTTHYIRTFNLIISLWHTFSTLTVIFQHMKYILTVMPTIQQVSISSAGTDTVSIQLD